MGPNPTICHIHSSKKYKEYVFSMSFMCLSKSCPNGFNPPKRTPKKTGSSHHLHFRCFAQVANGHEGCFTRSSAQALLRSSSLGSGDARRQRQIRRYESRNGYSASPGSIWKIESLLKALETWYFLDISWGMYVVNHVCSLIFPWLLFSVLVFFGCCVDVCFVVYFVLVGYHCCWWCLMPKEEASPKDLEELYDNASHSEALNPRVTRVTKVSGPRRYSWGV